MIIGKSGDKMFDWFKKNKWLVGLGFAFLIFGVPTIIHILFKLDFKISFLYAEWTAGDLLEYYGAILSFIGTVVLGVLALYQNKLIKDESDARILIQEKRAIEENMPKFVATSKGSNGNCTNLHFEIKNISNNLSSEIKLSDIKIISPDGSEFWKSTQIYTQTAMQPNEVMDVKLDNPSLKEDGYTFVIYMQCKDKYNEIHNYIVNGVYYVKNFFPKLSITEI